ncbi:cell division protein FtsK [Hahella sp. CCB-MM4]|uniref:DNA translocase FtsK n=1 Tax=Hahella sp. (strain CCB-MM4) TaxID=1926491 RepID=UPI000B9BED6B|nr:DNA translocase FtsK [Hahella sp. CCB-MM4]OZG73654.1 cell division protein FtsK [Hahella sp. CCB-MM4]
MAAELDQTRTKRYIEQGLREGLLILCVTLAAYLVIALISYDPNDPGWTNTGRHSQVVNYAGAVGAWIADVLRYFFGNVSYLFPLLFGIKTIQLFRHRHKKVPINWPITGLRVLGLILLMVAGCSLLAMYSVAGSDPHAGGILGSEVAKWSVSVFNMVGTTLIAVAFLLIGFSLSTGLSWLKIMDWVGGRTLVMFGLTANKLKSTSGSFSESMKRRAEEKAEEKKEKLAQKEEKKRKEPKIGQVDTELANTRADDSPKRKLLSFSKKESVKERSRESADDDAGVPVLDQPVSVPVEPESESGKKIKISPFQKKNAGESKRAKKDSQPSLFNFKEGPLPPLTLLDPPDPHKKGGFSKEALENLSELLETKLADFGVIAEVVEVNPGPVITRFEIQPAPGVKVSRISNLAKDLARSLAVLSVRVVEVIPGKSVVGIEIPNENREMVRLREVLSSSEYDNSHSPLSLGLGNDIAGNPVVENLAKMPHLLVAGTTGSGKSVGVNAMLLSMLYKATPEELRLIMIDPKMLELSIYDGIPHLLTPVVTDMKEAANALRWCVGEMERRYRLMAALGVRNLAGYNKKVKDAQEAGDPIMDPLWKASEHALDDEVPSELDTLPFIVVVVDEFADMMMIVGKKVEELIARIAQKARAAGIHLILATQRPSVDVITGLIKANVPTRIAFQVSSKIDSRTILDQGGAEQLLGHGDMLYMPPGTSLPIRVHGAFVADEEVHAVVSDWKQRGEPDYLDEILEGVTDSEYVASMDGGGGGENNNGTEKDELFDQAVAFVTESRRASISAVQRRLKIGYNRAANLVEAMEAAGVVSAAGHNGSREVLAPPPPRD